MALKIVVAKRRRERHTPFRTKKRRAAYYQGDVPQTGNGKGSQRRRDRKTFRYSLPINICNSLEGMFYAAIPLSPSSIVIAAARKYVPNSAIPPLQSGLCKFLTIIVMRPYSADYIH